MVDLTVKKVYCPKCQKLVRVRLERAGEKNQFNCVKCDYVIWQKQGYNWKYNKYA